MRKFGELRNRGSVDPAPAVPGLQQVYKKRQHRFGSFCFHFDAPVRFIPNPSGKAQLKRLLSDKIAKSDSLNLPFQRDMECLHPFQNRKFKFAFQVRMRQPPPAEQGPRWRKSL